MDVKRLEAGTRSSGAIIVGDMIYLGGVCGDMSLSRFEDQARDMIAKLETRLEHCGSDKHHLISATIYLKDMRYFDAFNQIWDAWIDRENMPTRCCVAVDLAFTDMLAEIVVTAYKK